MSEPISLETEAAAAAAAKWRGYANQAGGAWQPSACPCRSVGRRARRCVRGVCGGQGGGVRGAPTAYQRVAARARGHADRLDGTRQIFSDTDEEHAMLIRGSSTRRCQLMASLMASQHAPGSGQPQIFSAVRS